MSERLSPASPEHKKASGVEHGGIVAAILGWIKMVIGMTDKKS